MRDLSAEQLVANRWCQGRTGLRSSVAAGGDEPSGRRGKPTTGGLEPETIAHLIK